MPRRSQHSWVRGNCIGKGSFGIVHLALDKSNNHVFAVKSVNLKTSSSSHVESLNNEIQILRSLSSPYVVQYLKDDLTHESKTEVYQNLHIEYMPGGTVVDSSSSSSGKKFDEKIIRSYTRSIVSALNYVHSKGIVHCDVKGKNVLVGSAPGVVKLADFGSAKRISEGCGNLEEEEGGVMISPQGTPLWMAPEVIRQERQGPESDIWSLGCTVIEMINRRPPWKDCDTTMVFRIGFSDQLPEFPTQLSELGHDFLDKCLRRDPNERWTAEQLLQHPFVLNDTVTEPSPRCVLDWTNSEFHDDDDEDIQEVEEENQLNLNCNSKNSNSGSEDFLVSARDRIRRLASSRTRVVWESDGWEAVRSSSSVSPVIDRTGDDDDSSSSCEDGAEEMEGTSSDFFNLVHTVVEERVGTTSEYSDLSNPSRVTEETEIPRCFTIITTTTTTISSSSGCCSKAGFGCKHGLRKDCKKTILTLLIASIHQLKTLNERNPIFSSQDQLLSSLFLALSIRQAAQWTKTERRSISHFDDMKEGPDLESFKFEQSK